LLPLLNPDRPTRISLRIVVNLRPRMRPTLSKILGLALYASAAMAAGRATDGRSDAAQFSSAIGVALQADLKSALQQLDGISAAGLPEKKRAILTCMRQRFDAGKDPAIPANVDPWTADLLRIYRRYWRSVMLGSVTRDAGEQELARQLARHLGGSNRPKDLDAIEPMLGERLEAHGYHALFGVTAPLREFMLWRDEADETYPVELPDGPEPVHVTMMDGFLSFGWLGYATCDYRHSGGWAKPDRLFAVRSAYDLDSEDFHVSYLAHEGQHFSDYRRFPGLAQADLEYRAKLVELAKAGTTLYDLIDAFSGSGSDDREQAHAWANRRVIGDLARKLFNEEAATSATWRRCPVEQINAAAADLLKQDDVRRSPTVRASG
jgi:hypothetical protein